MATRHAPLTARKLTPQTSHLAKKNSNPLREFFSLLLLPPVFIFYSFLLPSEVEIYLGSVRFLAYRIALFASIPWIVAGIINNKFKPHFIDLLVFISAIWPVFAWASHKGLVGGIESGGAIFADIILAWMVARIAFTDPHMLGKILRAILPGIVFIAGIFFIESIGRKLIYRETFQTILGATSERGGRLSYEIRLGILRAYGPFAHPIHGGILIASFAPLYWARLAKNWSSISGIISSFAAIFTVSSGAMIALGVGIALSVYQFIQLHVKELSWQLLGITALILLILLEIFSQNGVISIIVRYLSFGGSGSYRTFIWQYCIIEIQNFPLYGIGERPWNRPRWLGRTDTIDAHYLALATKSGLLASIPLLIAALYINIKLFGLGKKHKDRYTHTTVIPLAIVLTAFNVCAFVVAYWSAAFIWYSILLGAGLTVIQMQSRRNFHHR